ncbi:MAG: hypothetical protein EON90_02260 [Brevundimonas sp.]|nr:MAG: hypothetical protein EON90_02260 [Brevundimonas sp.]
MLSRASEAAYVDRRFDDAEALAKAALIAAPFDVRALRVAGLALEQKGSRAAADEAVTLAGNWSLRDDPAHAWLINRRFEAGDVGGGLAHADTLVRRREDVQPSVFDLFTKSAAEARGFSALVGLIGAEPPWSADYFQTLYKTPSGRALAANLAIALKERGKPLPKEEVSRLYYSLVTGNQDAGVALVRSRLEPGAAERGVANGNFEAEASALPFTWRLSDQPGLTSSIEPGPEGGRALWITYDGIGAQGLAEQALTLAPGDYVLSASVRNDEQSEAKDLRWVVVCGAGGIARVTIDEVKARSAGRPGWSVLTRTFRVPEGCPLQWLWLEAPEQDRSRSRAAWFDDLSIREGAEGS